MENMRGKPPFYSDEDDLMYRTLKISVCRQGTFKNTFMIFAHKYYMVYIYKYILTSRKNYTIHYNRTKKLRK